MITIGNKVSGKEKEFFSTQMSLMLQSGIPLPRALDVVYRQTKNNYFKKILYSIAASVQHGKQLSQALAHYPRIFSTDYIAVLKSGESTGQLDRVFADLSRRQKESNTFRSGVLNAMIYPLIIIGAIILVSIYLIVAVIPNITQLFTEQNINIPLSTKILIAIANFINNYWYVIIIVIVAIIFLLRMYLSSQNGKLMLSKIQLNMPVLNDLFTSGNIAIFSRTLATLIRHGVPIIEAVKISKSTMTNIIFQNSTNDMLSSLERGMPLSKSIIENSIYPPLVGQMILVGEQSGKLDKALDNIADNYHKESSIIIKNLSSIVEPVLIVIVGLGVAYVVYAILVPIYQISQIT